MRLSMIAVDYAPRPAVVSARDAAENEAPQLYDDCPGNEAYFYQAGDKAKTDAAFADAAHVIEQRLVINRVTANPIEPRGVIGMYDAGTRATPCIVAFSGLGCSATILPARR